MAGHPLILVCKGKAGGQNTELHHPISIQDDFPAVPL